MHYFMRESVRTVQCVMMGRRRVMNVLGLDISSHGHNHLLKIKLHLCIHEMYIWREIYKSNDCFVCEGSFKKPVYKLVSHLKS